MTHYRSNNIDLINNTERSFVFCFLYRLLTFSVNISITFRITNYFCCNFVVMAMFYLVGNVYTIHERAYVFMCACIRVYV